jgi:hypothetical protein
MIRLISAWDKAFGCGEGLAIFTPLLGAHGSARALSEAPRKALHVLCADRAGEFEGIRGRCRRSQEKRAGCSTSTAPDMWANRKGSIQSPDSSVYGRLPLVLRLGNPVCMQG